MTDAALLKLVTGLLLVFVSAWVGWATRARYFDLPQIKDAIDEFKNALHEHSNAMAMIGLRQDGHDKELLKLDRITNRLTEVEKDLAVVKEKLNLSKRADDHRQG